MAAFNPESAVIPSSATELTIVPPREGWEMGRISWVDTDRNGLIYLIQRGDKADPVVVIDRQGRVVRSWGAGLYAMPHSIRIDPDGNVWTTDARSSTVIEFAPDGRELMRIAVGGQPQECRGGFCGTTDVAFGRNGHVYVTDGYANARVLEYTRDGRKVREWGTRGAGPGQFHLPHSIVADGKGNLFVADRENGRVQRFDEEGRWLGSWPTDGNPYSLELVSGVLWIDVLRHPGSTPVEPTLVKADPRTGRAAGHAEVGGGHGTAALPRGDQFLVPARTRLLLTTIGRTP